MRTSAAIKEEIENLRSEVEAIVAVATKENREINDDESDRVDMAKEKIPALQRELERVTKTEGLVAGAFAGRLGNNAKSSGKLVTLNRGDSAKELMDSVKVDNAFGHFVRAKILGPDATDVPREVRNAMSTNDNPAGGFLVPDSLFPDVVDAMRARSVLSQAGMRTLVQRTGDMHIAGVDGDPTFGVYGENQTITESAVAFKLTTLSALKVATLIKASRELAEDAANFVELVSQVLQASMAAQIDYYGIRGGSGFNGLEVHPNIDATTGVGAIDWLDLAAATTLIRNANGEPNAAIMAPSIHDALLNAQTGDGVNASRGWLGKCPSLEMVRMFHTTNCTTSKVIVGDFTNLVCGLRTRPLVEISTDGDAFATHSVKIKITTRVDFAVVRPAMFHRLEGVTAS